MAQYYLCPLGAVISYFNAAGIPLSGGLIWTYLQGTSTPTSTWTTSSGNTANSNPIQLNSAGQIPQLIWQQGGVPIKVQVSTNAGTVLAPVFGTQIGPTFDNISGIDDPAVVLAELANASSGFGADLVANVVKSYDIASSVRAANVPSLVAGQTLVIYVEGMASVTDGLGGVFAWNATSTATDNGYSVLKPTGEAGAGRYLRQAPTYQQLYASKNAATSQATNTTITIDPNLQITLATGTYAIEGWINDTGGTSAGGLKGGLYFGGTGSGAWAMNGVGTGTTVVALTALGTPAELQSAQTGVGSMEFNGFVTVTVAGVLSFQWAQQGSNGTASLVAQGSWLRCTQLTNTLAAMVTPASISSISTAAAQTTAAVLAAGVGGTGMYVSYAWTWLSGGVGITITSTSAASTTFSASGLSAPETLSGVAQVTVKDSAGSTATGTCAVMIICGSAFTYTGTLTAGYISVGGYPIGYGYYGSDGGSLSPTTDNNGNTIQTLWTTTGNGVSGTLILQLAAASNPTQSYFTNLSIGGANYTSASAAGYNYSGGVAIWDWTGAPGFTTGTMYPVVYQ